MEIGIIRRIFEFISQKGYTQQEFGDRLMLSRAAISAWKNGSSQPDGDRIIEILIAYPEIDANWLIRGDDSQVGISNVMHGSNLTNQQGENLTSVDPHLWKERYMMSLQIIKEKDEQIKLLKNISKIG